MKVAQSCPTLCDPMYYTVWNSPGQNTAVGSCCSPGDLLNPGLLHCRWILPAKPQGKPKNTEVGSPSLLQGIFLDQESNWGLLHWRQVLYQLSYQGSPYKGEQNWKQSVLRLPAFLGEMGIDQIMYDCEVAVAMSATVRRSTYLGGLRAEIEAS